MASSSINFEIQNRLSYMQFLYLKLIVGVWLNLLLAIENSLSFPNPLTMLQFPLL